MGQNTQNNRLRKKRDEQEPLPIGSRHKPALIFFFLCLSSYILQCSEVAHGSQMGAGCPSTPECHYTCASWWGRWCLFLIESRKCGEGGVVIDRTSLIVAALSLCWIIVAICLRWIRDIKITGAFIFQGQRIHKELDNCRLDLQLWSQKKSFSFFCALYFGYDALWGSWLHTCHTLYVSVKINFKSMSI